VSALITPVPHDQAPAETLWAYVTLGEWRFLGLRLIARVVLLTLRHRFSRTKVKDRLAELFGLQVSTGLIDHAIRRAGRAIAPLEAEWLLRWPKITRLIRSNKSTSWNG